MILRMRERPKNILLIGNLSMILMIMRMINRPTMKIRSLRRALSMILMNLRGRVGRKGKLKYLDHRKRSLYILLLLIEQI